VGKNGKNTRKEEEERKLYRTIQSAYQKAERGGSDKPRIWELQIQHDQNWKREIAEITGREREGGKPAWEKKNAQGKKKPVRKNSAYTKATAPKSNYKTRLLFPSTLEGRENWLRKRTNNAQK